MLRTTTLALLLVASGATGALAQSFPTDAGAVATNGGLTRPQATMQLMSAGYSNVGTLINSKGSWTGQATKGGATKVVTVDTKGKISAR